VADFLSKRNFGRHVRSMRLLYAERQAALVEAASQQLSDLLEVEPSDAGMHLVGWLTEGVDDQKVAAVAAVHRLEPQPISAHSA
jgi:GntR family transcriptional regulator / MocR family aminotransferase